MTADELDDVTAERDQLRADLHTQRHAPFVEGNEHRRAETIVVMERGLEQLQALLDDDPVCPRCEGQGFDGQGEPCAHVQEPDPDAAYDWDRDTRALDESGA